jgi:hypothetical protein
MRPESRNSQTFLLVFIFSAILIPHSFTQALNESGDQFYDSVLRFQDTGREEHGGGRELNIMWRSDVKLDAVNEERPLVTTLGWR